MCVMQLPFFLFFIFEDFIILRIYFFLFFIYHFQRKHYNIYWQFEYILVPCIHYIKADIAHLKMKSFPGSMRNALKHTTIFWIIQSKIRTNYNDLSIYDRMCWYFQYKNPFNTLNTSFVWTFFFLNNAPSSNAFFITSKGEINSKY